MTSNITIIGAGMAGLLAGCMLRSDVKAILEKQDVIPNNHSALLRFRSGVVGDVLGVPFKKVAVMKTVAPWRNPLADALAYSFKCNGRYTLRSSLSAKSELETRYIAPHDFIDQMARRVQAPIFLKSTLSPVLEKSPEPIISTMPMPVLMDLLRYDGERPTFEYRHGCNINVAISNCDAYGTIYVASPDIEFNRVSLTGDRLTIEFAGLSAKDIEPDVSRYVKQAISMLGIKHSGPTLLSDQKYAKILPCDEKLRKRFIMWATEHRNVYSLGRFATWRPGLLLDDVVNDVRVIQAIIANDTYMHRKAT